MNSFISAINTAFAQPSVWSFGAALLWGLVSVFLSPCHLGAIPLLIGYINRDEKKTDSNTGGAGRSFLVSLVYGLGLLVMLALVGVVTSAMGRIMGSVGGPLIIAVAIFLIFSGLWLMDIPPLNRLSLSTSFRPNQSGLWGAFLLGLVYGIVLGPCSFAFLAPMLGFVFSAALQEVSFGITLMLLYALGHTAAIVLAGTLGRSFSSMLARQAGAGFGLLFKRFLGLVIALVGIWQIWSYWR